MGVFARKVRRRNAAYVGVCGDDVRIELAARLDRR